jgi:hypothetical protein
MQFIKRPNISHGIITKRRQNILSQSRNNKLKPYQTRTRTIAHSFNIGGQNEPTLEYILLQQSHIIGNFVGYFVLFSALLNWFYYNEINRKNKDD